MDIKKNRCPLCGIRTCIERNEKGEKLIVCMNTLCILNNLEQSHLAENPSMWEKFSENKQIADTTKKTEDQLEFFTAHIPQTYGEAINIFPFLTCEPHEWDNRTTAENTIWLIKELHNEVLKLRQYHKTSAPFFETLLRED